MEREERMRSGAEMERAERLIAQENNNAVLTMWIGLGSILSLLLSSYLGSLWHGENKLYLTGGIMALLLIVSVILYFAPAKRDQRWYLVCAILNHGGIGLAVPLLLELLDLAVRPLNLAVSGVPAGAILFGAAIFYVGGEGENRRRLLYTGAAILGLILAGALLKFSGQRSEFWLCMAICALLSCGNLAALIWANRSAEQRSVYQGLAVVSFSVYLLLLAAAAVALIAAASGSGSSSNRSRSRSKREKSGGNARGFGGTGSGGSGSRTLLGGLFAGGNSGRVYRPRGYFPMYLWYYTPYNRYASINRMQVSEDEKDALRSRYRRRRLVILLLAVGIVAAAIAAAVLLGRG